MCSFIISGYLLCGPGAIAYTPVMELVAERRYQAGWGLTQNPNEYDLLIGLSDCGLLGRSGWLMAGDKIYTALVADCERPEHQGQLIAAQLLGDVNLEIIHSQESYLILKPATNGPRWWYEERH